MNQTEISVGEQQIISVLRALIIKPSILFLDEPTSSLDPEYTQIVENLDIQAGKTIWGEEDETNLSGEDLPVASCIAYSSFCP